MPSVRVTNFTTAPLNIGLKQITALHWENEVQPGQTIKLKPGKVWFTLEAKRDTGKSSRYSMAKSAATIAIISVAVSATALTWGAPLAAEAGVAAAALAGPQAVAVASAGAAATKKFLVSQGANIAKLSALALPRAIKRVSAEFSGLSAVQEEALSIIQSPNVGADLRSNTAGVLDGLQKAWKEDKKRKEREEGSPGHGPATREAREEEEALEGEDVEGPRVESSVVENEAFVRAHGIYVSDRKEYAIRAGNDGKLQIWDVKTNEQLK